MSPLDPGSGHLTFGRFQCQEKLPSADPFQMYRARTQGLAGFERAFAIKILPGNAANVRPDAAQRLLAVASRATAVRDPRIGQVVDCGISPEGIPFLVTEFVFGTNLEALRVLCTHPAGSPGAAAARLPQNFLALLAHLGAEVALALAAAHRGAPPLVHGALSPPNILLSSHGQVKVVDFGLRSAVLPTRGASQRRALSPYVAPEMLLTNEGSREADVFALGAMLFELATGKTPPSAKSPRSANDLARALAATTEPLRNAIVALVQADQGSRPDADAAADLLRRANGGLFDTVLRAQLGSLVRRIEGPAHQRARSQSAGGSAAPAAPEPARGTAEAPGEAPRSSSPAAAIAAAAAPFMSLVPPPQSEAPTPREFPASTLRKPANRTPVVAAPASGDDEGDAVAPSFQLGFGEVPTRSVPLLDVQSQLSQDLAAVPESEPLPVPPVTPVPPTPAPAAGPMSRPKVSKTLPFGALFAANGENAAPGDAALAVAAAVKNAQDITKAKAAPAALAPQASAQPAMAPGAPAAFGAVPGQAQDAAKTADVMLADADRAPVAFEAFREPEAPPYELDAADMVSEPTAADMAPPVDPGGPPPSFVKPVAPAPLATRRGAGLLAPPKLAMSPPPATPAPDMSNITTGEMEAMFAPGVEASNSVADPSKSVTASAVRSVAAPLSPPPSPRRPGAAEPGFENVSTGFFSRQLLTDDPGDPQDAADPTLGHPAPQGEGVPAGAVEANIHRLDQLYSRPQGPSAAADDLSAVSTPTPEPRSRRRGVAVIVASTVVFGALGIGALVFLGGGQQEGVPAVARVPTPAVPASPKREAKPTAAHPPVAKTIVPPVATPDPAPPPPPPVMKVPVAEPQRDPSEGEPLARDDQGRILFDVVTEPPGAVVWINGGERGAAPLTVALRDTHRKMVIIRPGFRTVQEDLDLGRLPRIRTFTLTPAVPPGDGDAKLKVECQQAGKYPISIDGTDTGLLCPMELPLRAGKYQVSIFVPWRFKSYPMTVQLAPGENKTVSFAK